MELVEIIAVQPHLQEHFTVYFSSNFEKLFLANIIKLNVRWSSAS